MTGRDGDQNRVHSDRRLSGPHVGLQKAVHGVSRGKIFTDFADRLVLSLREGKGKQPSNSGIDFRRRRQDGRRAPRFPGPPPQRKSQLKLKQVVKDQPVAACFVFLYCLWKVHPADGLSQIGQLESLAKSFRHRVGDQIDVRFDRRPDDASHLVHRETFGQSVSRQKASINAVAFVGLTDPLHAGIGELPAARVPFRLAGEQDGFAPLKLVDHPRLIEPGAANVKPVALQQHGNQAAAAPRRSAVDINDLATNRLQLARSKFDYGTDVCQIEHVARKVPQQILDRNNAEVCQQPGPLRSEAAHILNRHPERIIVHGFRDCLVFLTRLHFAPTVVMLEA